MHSVHGVHMVHTWTALEPLDAVAVQKLRNSAECIGALARYNYQKDSGNRIGGLDFVHIRNDSSICALRHLRPLSFDWGILDIDFPIDLSISNNDGKNDDDILRFPALAVGSDGALHYFMLHASGPICFAKSETSEFSVKRHRHWNHRSCNAAVHNSDPLLALSFAQQPLNNSHSVDTDFTVVWGCSDGTVCYLKTLEQIQPDILEAHYETLPGTHKRISTSVWAVGLNPFDKNQFVSGGDDAKLKSWDIRSGPLPLWVDSEAHTSGVTTTVYDPCNEHHLWTGSYDGILRLWDMRQRRICGSGNIGNGIWRIKFANWGRDSTEARMLIAATHGGCMVLSRDKEFNSNAEHTIKSRDIGFFDGKLDGWQITTHQNAHESMAYGIAPLPSVSSEHSISNLEMFTSCNTEILDWGKTNQGGSNLCMSCSFYDRKAALWRYA